MWDTDLIVLVSLASGLLVLCWIWMPRAPRDEAAPPALRVVHRASGRGVDVSRRADGVDVRVRVDQSRLGGAPTLAAANGRETRDPVVGVDQIPRETRMRGIQQ